MLGRGAIGKPSWRSHVLDEKQCFVALVNCGYQTIAAS